MEWSCLEKQSIQKSTNNRFIVVIYIFSIFFVLFAVSLSLLVSSVKVSVPEIVSIVLKHTFGLVTEQEIKPNVEMIIWNIRLPRILIALLIGAALSPLPEQPFKACSATRLLIRIRLAYRLVLLLEPYACFIFKLIC